MQQRTHVESITWDITHRSEGADNTEIEDPDSDYIPRACAPPVVKRTRITPKMPHGQP